VNTTGHDNTAIGTLALVVNSIGSNNIAVGSRAGGNITSGDNNIDIGNSGVKGDDDTIRIGKQGTQTVTFVAGIYGASIAGSAVCVDSSGQLGTCSDPSALTELHRQVRENRRQAEQIGKLEKQIDVLKKKDAQIDALMERLNALERQVRAARPQRLVAATR
jgi:hypothetical protein